MADLVVEGLAELLADIKTLIAEFEGAMDLQDSMKGQWGQHNANLSMGDFAWNWATSRKKMVEDLEGLRDKIEGADQAWTDAELELFKSLKEARK